MIKKRNRKKKLYFKFVIPFLLFLIIVLVIFLVQSKILLIQNVDINLSKVNCINSEDLKRGLNLQNQNLLFLDSDKFRKDLEKKHYCIKQIDLNKIFPNKVQLNIKGREAFAKLIVLKNTASDSAGILYEATNSSNLKSDNFIIDDEGVVFNKEKNASLLNIFIKDENLMLGKKISQFDIKKITKILRILNELRIFVKSVILSGEDSILIESNPQISMSSKENLDLQLASLQLILTEAKINEESIEFIDLRFDKPIVRYAPKKK